ncbi:MAG TPA: histidine phosphatase family protein [Ktedonobacterales bacterium]|jgi:probable phosphoglycerate mutase|nr:histidine phosphatase family protein [Ktedonobacterales bacterium]
MRTNLYLIRHGEAVCNVDRTIAGMRSDTGLSELGVLQAERLRARLAATGEIAADALIASTLPRARQTAEIIAPALDLPIIPDDDAQELRPGEADGLNIKDFLDRYGPFSDARDDPFLPLSPGGESWGAFMARVGDFLYRVARDYAGKTVVIVCHGGVIDASLLIGLGIGASAPSPGQFHTRNASITHWERERINNLDTWRLNRYNDNLHTRDIGAAHAITWTPLHAREGSPTVPLPTESPEQD